MNNAKMMTAIIGSKGVLNPNYMDGFSPLSISTNAVQSPTGVYSGYEWAGLSTGMEMTIGGEVAFKTLSGWDSNFHIAKITGGSGDLGVASAPSSLYWYTDTPTGGGADWVSISGGVTLNNWVVLKRNAIDSLQILTTPDGVNFTVRGTRAITSYLIGFNPTADKLGIWGYIDGKMFYPQSKNLIAI